MADRHTHRSVDVSDGHLEDVHAWFAAIVDSSNDPIISKDLNGVITSWNRGAERLFGYTAHEAVGRPVTMLMPPEHIGEEPGILERIRRGESVDHYETVRRRKDGTLLDISLTVSPITDAQGRMIGTSNVARDITERKQADTALRESEARLRAFAVQLEQSVAERTAELVQSQNRLRGLTNELNLTEQRERKRMATELHDHLQQILVLAKLKLGQGKRMAETLPACAEVMRQVDQLLTDSLTYTRTLATELSPQVLREHGLGAALRWLAESMKQHDMTVTVRIPASDHVKLPEDHAILLFQSVRELLINALKHAGTGEATIILNRRDDQLQIEVQDRGVGFDLVANAAGTQSDISSKFGLFSIDERMKAIGGRFELQSVPGQGTTALLSLPVGSQGRAGEISQRQALRGQHAANSARSIVSSLPVAHSKPIRVLLVDDHAMMRQGLRSVLDGYEDVEVVGEAADGEEAVRAVEQLDPRVVIMDINMPNKNGIEATAHIKSHSPSTTVIGLSVNADAENQGAMTRAGAAVLLTKEAAVEELYQAIQQALYATSVKAAT